MMETMLNKILEDAKAFKTTHRSASWQDYEFYKRQLHACGYYGYEGILANILGL